MISAPEIQFMNHQALVFAQSILRDSKLAGMLFLGLNQDKADFILSLTPSELVRLSSADLMLFKFGFDGKDLEDLTKFIEGDDLTLTKLHISSTTGA